MASSTARPRRTSEDLLRASISVHYEFAMLFGCYSLLHETPENAARGDRETAISNALIHAALLAARSLLAFLYSPARPRVTDIIAEDFFDDPDVWRKQRIIPSPEMTNGDLINQISKRLAHLTWDRTEGTKPLWGIFHIVWSVGLALQSFLDLADEATIAKMLRTDVGEARTVLQNVLNERPEMNGAMAPALEYTYFDDLDHVHDDDSEMGESGN